MTQLVLTKTGIRQGVWKGILTGGGAAKPAVAVTLLDQPVAGVTVAESGRDGIWTVAIPIPPGAISEGVQTFLITEPQTGSKLGSFAVIAGEVLGDDMRAEIDLLRAELDMLKRAFRRHCVETT